MDVTLATFEAEVIEASATVPVLVDFWAPWCGPCRSLGPLLEKLEADYQGRFKLAKINVDENPELAGHFQARSIPLVVAIVNGRMVDQFTGALPEGQLRQFIDRLLPAPHQTAHQQALQALEEGNVEEAERFLREALSLQADYDAARFDYVELLLNTERPEDAQAQFEKLSPQAKHEPQYATLETALSAIAASLELPDETALLEQITRNPDDLGAYLELANQRIAHRQWEPAMQVLLDIIKRDRSFQDDIGRKTLIQVFELASAQPDLVSRYRRQLSSLLF